MMISSWKNGGNEERTDEIDYDNHSNIGEIYDDDDDDYSHASSTTGPVDRFLETLETKSGFKLFQGVVGIWALVAVAKNLGVGRHVHLDPGVAVDKTSYGMRRANEVADRPRFALVRPVSPSDVDKLLESLERWDLSSPCGKYRPDWAGENYYDYGEQYDEQERPVVDLVLSYSRRFGDLEGFDTLRAAQDLFNERNGWGGCFAELVSVEAGIDPEYDIYDPQPVQTNPRWVNGPNEQFRKTYQHIKSRGYASMILMESDVQAQVDGWLDLLLSEVKKNQPFAVLGSKYDGHSWDNFKDQVPTALRDHLNGNAVYNTTHALLEKIVAELEAEQNTFFNAIPYDYRISQMWTEGSKGIPSDFPYRHMVDENTGKPVVLPSKMDLFRGWYEEYGEEQPLKVAHVLANYGATNFLAEQVGGVPLVHGKGAYLPHDPNTHKITLVVSDWEDDRAQQLIDVLDYNKHPFAEVLVMRTWRGWGEWYQSNKEDTLMDKLYSLIFGDDDGVDKSLMVQSTKVRVVDRAAPDFMDLCEAPIETEYFMITNAYHKVAPDVGLMFASEKDASGFTRVKPLISYTPSETEYCQDYAACRETLKLGREIYPDLDKVVLDFDMVYETAARNDFCEFWKNAYGPNGALIENREGVIGSPDVPRGPTASSYLAYLYSIGMAETTYAFSDRTLEGSNDVFLKVLAEEEQYNHQLHFWSFISPKMRNRINRKRRIARQQGRGPGNGQGRGNNYGSFDTNRRYTLESPSFLVAD